MNISMKRIRYKPVEKGNNDNPLVSCEDRYAWLTGG